MGGPNALDAIASASGYVMTHYPRPPVTPETRIIQSARFHLGEADEELVTALQWASHPNFQRENVALALKPLKAAVRELEGNAGAGEDRGDGIDVDGLS